jgi:hypothetical protein
LRVYFETRHLAICRVGGEWTMEGIGPSEEASLLQAMEASMLRLQAVLVNQHEVVRANQAAEQRHHLHLIQVYRTRRAQNRGCGAREPAPGTLDHALHHPANRGEEGGGTGGGGGVPPRSRCRRSKPQLQNTYPWGRRYSLPSQWNSYMYLRRSSRNYHHLESYQAHILHRCSI